MPLYYMTVSLYLIEIGEYFIGAIGWKNNAFLYLGVKDDMQDINIVNNGTICKRCGREYRKMTLCTKKYKNMIESLDYLNVLWPFIFFLRTFNIYLEILYVSRALYDSSSSSNINRKKIWCSKDINSFRKVERERKNHL